MEKPLINATSDVDFPLKSPPSSFHFANGINNTRTPFQLSDIEMVALRSLTYTSLRDLLPASPPPIMSPTYNRGDSWREIPIKDPLLKHAAWAYLQPMMTPAESDDRSYFWKLMDKCCGRCGCGLFGCFGGFFSDVNTSIKKLFTEGESENEYEDEDDKVD